MYESLTSARSMTLTAEPSGLDCTMVFLMSSISSNCPMALIKSLSLSRSSSPVSRLRLFAPKAEMSLLIETAYRYKAFLSTSTIIFLSRPPPTSTLAAPFILFILSFICSSTNLRSSSVVLFLLVTAKMTMGTSVCENCAMMGFSASLGSFSFTLANFSLTSIAASCMSIPRSKLKTTVASPSFDMESILSSFDTVLTASSIGRVTIDSTSVGGIPPRI